MRVLLEQMAIVIMANYLSRILNLYSKVLKRKILKSLSPFHPHKREVIFS